MPEINGNFNGSAANVRRRISGEYVTVARGNLPLFKEMTGLNVGKSDLLEVVEDTCYKLPARERPLKIRINNKEITMDAGRFDYNE